MFEVQCVYFEKDEESGLEVQTMETEQFKTLPEALAEYQARKYSGKYELVRLVCELESWSKYSEQ